jgi:hypothetical protein
MLLATQMQYLQGSLPKEGALLKERKMTSIKDIFPTNYKLIW